MIHTNHRNLHDSWTNNVPDTNHKNHREAVDAVVTAGHLRGKPPTPLSPQEHPPPLLPGSHRHHRHRRIPQLKATGGLRRILRVGRMPRLPFAVRGGHHHSLWGSALLPLTREKRSEWSGWGCPLRPSLSLSTCEWKCSRLALLGFYSASFFRENLISIIYYIL